MKQLICLIKREAGTVYLALQIYSTSFILCTDSFDCLLNIYQLNIIMKEGKTASHLLSDTKTEALLGRLHKHICVLTLIC